MGRFSNLNFFNVVERAGRLLGGSPVSVRSYSFPFQSGSMIFAILVVNGLNVNGAGTVGTVKMAAGPPAVVNNMCMSASSVKRAAAPAL